MVLTNLTNVMALIESSLSKYCKPKTNQKYILTRIIYQQKNIRIVMIIILSWAGNEL